MKHKDKSTEIRLYGMPISKGIAIGKPFFLSSLEEAIPKFSISSVDLEKEVQRYRFSVGRAYEDLKRLRQQLEKELILEGAAILDAQLQILQDPILTSEVEKGIRKTKQNAESVFETVIKHYEKKFNELADPFFRERFKDIQDVSRRVQAYLLENGRISLAEIPPDSILFADELTTSDAAEANGERIQAFVSKKGGVMSHAAIVAKAKGIPYVTSIDFNTIEPFANSLVIIDGGTGEFIVNPTPQTLLKYQEVQQKYKNHQLKLVNMATLPAETFDGFQVRLSANIESTRELALLHEYGGNGVGLFRSEYAFLSDEKFPSEEEQFHIYKNIVQQMKGLPIVIRTFDVGGDKFIGDFVVAEERNPYLGCRAIRFSLKERDLFKIQLRAILRASAFGNVSIMFPMVSGLSELQEAKALVKEVQGELRTKKIPIADYTKVGCMIEVPSAALIADLLANECDFLSIGTNDLVQYAIAVDRGNQAMSELYNPTHPSVIRLIKMIVTEANHHGIPVTLCGEIAADPRFTPLLLGLGVHELSVSVRHIPIIKDAVRSLSIVEVSKMADYALKLHTSQEIQELLNAGVELPGFPV